MNGFAGDLRIERSGSCARARGIREDMKVRERERIDEAQGRFVIGFGFAGEAGDDVGSDRGVREKFADELYAAGVVFGAIPAMHGAENVVRAGLKRHVEMVGDAISASEKRDEILRDVERLDGAYAEARKRSFVEDAAQEIENIGAGSKIAAPGAEIDAAKDDFLEAGIGQAADLGKNRFWREAAALAADEWDDAEGATIVAAVLNFEGGASVIPLSAEDGSDEDIAGSEDVAD